MAQKGAGYCGPRKLWGEDGSPLGFVWGTLRGPYLRLMTSITTFRQCYCFWTSRWGKVCAPTLFYQDYLWHPLDHTPPLISLRPSELFSCQQIYFALPDIDAKSSPITKISSGCTVGILAIKPIFSSAQGHWKDFSLNRFIWQTSGIDTKSSPIT
ncbi:hypothetical protein CEXT_275551 [Caerostris extrusa]|uniref:Uncharacterized protein n=1 Tax=Caerostris extrusa TaxID=172846 RepID=A0AAV4PIE5_CAEEX|nr:hypothetical protein CEXT_275551 [Caerostris extrusa]